MRIAAVSDIHGDMQATEYLENIERMISPDLIVICGDITTFGPTEVAEKILSGLNKKCVAVPGNCDPDDVLNIIEKYCISLHMRHVEIDGIDFVGFGGAPVCSLSTPREFEEEEIKKRLEEIMVPNCILVTHAPPLGINDLTRTGKRLGSRAIADICQKFKPRIVLSGHVHEARGVLEKDGTIFGNPGSLRDGYAILADIRDNIEIKIVDIKHMLQKL